MIAIIDGAFAVAILMLSVVIHEVSHGYMANRLGDPTARLAGRLTLNPFRHLDLFGSVIVPLMTYLTGGFVFGWAKPVPYNPWNIKQKYGDALVAVAGPLSNALIAVFFGLALRFGLPANIFSAGAIKLMSSIVVVNIVLAVFNLVPLPPLDGSKILFSFLPAGAYSIQEFLERFGLPIVFIFVFFIWQFIYPVVIFLFSHLTGLSV
jgi:Zn-dependent protease